MATINLTGLATGLDTSALIDQLMAIERQPRTRLATQQADQQASKSALQAVSDALKKLQTAGQALSDPTIFGNKQAVSIGNAGTATATMLSGAPTGGYTLQVERLARSSQASYAYTVPTADGTVAVAGAGFNDAIAVTAGTSASDLVARINGDPSLHVVASVTTVDGAERISFASRATGAASGFTASASGVLADEVTKAGQDALVRIDGEEHTSATNVVDDAIPGVRLALRGVDTVGTTVTVTAPGADTAAVGKIAKDFVDAYNSALDLLRTTTAVTATSSGQLGGDQGLVSLQAQLRSALVSMSGGAASLPLEALGISTGKASGTATYSADAVQGKLTFDADALTAALTTDPAAVRSVLTQSGGVIKSLVTTLASYTGADGTLTSRISLTGQDITDIGKRMDDFDVRLTARETALKAQFASLEATISKWHDQSSWLTGQIAALQSS
ncbi:flagellar filament capping protein FliD [Patulibacter sp. NPDC049589]|uniref:flagellar filament capping protein FliD n=1 Tax=Patulibacter sp. NPDC049589 TaxID=3154731 RepID=UPI00341209CD